MRTILTGAGLALLLTASAASAQSGLLGKAEVLAPLTLSSGKPLADKPYEVVTGKYYRIDIVADGSAELAVSAPELFRNMWINEVVINDIEVRPLGLDSLEFDDEGTATISFVLIRPGTFKINIPGVGDNFAATFEVRSQ